MVRLLKVLSDLYLYLYWVSVLLRMQLFTVRFKTRIHLACIWFNEFSISLVWFNEFSVSLVWFNEFSVSFVWFNEFSVSFVWFNEFSVSFAWLHFADRF